MRIAYYSDRLSSSLIRRKFHEARYIWLSKNIRKHVPNVTYALELGCFDGKSVEYLPPDFKEYHGFDANWEGGFDSAKSKNKDKRVTFDFCSKPTQLKVSQNTNVFICLEALEHLEHATLIGYLDKLKSELPEGCRIFVSVPNEIGLIFLAKRFAKLFFFKDHVPTKYSLKEFLLQFLGQTNYVKHEYGHKGFHWKKLVKLLSSRFDLISVEGIHFPLLPTFLNASIAIILVQRK